MAKGKSSSSSSGKTPPKYRSAVNGQYVKPSYAKSHPNTTVKESK